MTTHTTLTVGVLIAAVVLLPTAASAQRGHGRHHGGHHDGHHDGRAVRGPVVVIGHPAAVTPPVARPLVVAPLVVVQQPVIGRGGFGSTPVRTGFGSIAVRTGFGTAPVRTGFGSIPMRTGFGTIPIRTGFGSIPVRTGFGVQPLLVEVPVADGRHHDSKSRHSRGPGQRHGAGGVVVFGHP